jgi:hypothetical protein
LRLPPRRRILDGRDCLEVKDVKRMPESPVEQVLDAALARATSGALGSRPVARILRDAEDAVADCRAAGLPWALVAARLNAALASAGRRPVRLDTLRGLWRDLRRRPGPDPESVSGPVPAPSRGASADPPLAPGPAPRPQPALAEAEESPPPVTEALPRSEGALPSAVARRAARMKAAREGENGADEN